VHESAKTTSKTVARDAERQRRRELEKSWNHLGGRRELPPTLEQAGKEYQESRLGRVSVHTAGIDKNSLKHLVSVFGSSLLCDITAENITRYQKKRQQDEAQGRTINMEVGVLRGVLNAHRMWEPLARDVHMLPERKDIGRALSLDEERHLREQTMRRDSACHTATVLWVNQRISFEPAGTSPHTVIAENRHALLKSPAQVRMAFLRPHAAVHGPPLSGT
jgi:hypothetical protein